MSTKLDENFVSKMLALHPDADHAINTLANEVRRLEGLQLRLEAENEQLLQEIKDLKHECDGTAKDD